MKALNRLFGGRLCSYSRRFRRRDGGSGSRPALPAKWRRKHRETCDDCRLRERREQQYLERLRGASVPAASEDLTARLLARTAELARDIPAAAVQPSPDSAATEHSPPHRGLRAAPGQDGLRSRVRLAAGTAGAAAAAAALMAGSAYLVGGYPVPPDAGEMASAFRAEDPPAFAASGTPDAGTPDAGTVAAGMMPGWSLTGEPAISPPGALTAEQLAALRSQGWTCPELQELGYHLVWARGLVVAGEDIVELRLTDGRHFTTVLEQRSAAPSGPGASGRQQPADPPVNLMTGHPAAADGFTAVSAQGAGLPAGSGPEPVSAAGSGRLWANPAAPFRAIYQSSGGTFTFVSDQPAAQAGVSLAALMRASVLPQPEPSAGKGRGAESTTPAGITSRIERGLTRLLRLLTP